MKIWLDAQISPSIASWMRQRFGLEVFALRDLGLLCAGDEEIFLSARAEQAILISKDIDFLYLIERKGTPPKLIWLTVGNTSNANLKRILEVTLENALLFLAQGEELVEITES